jgi:hypothetical protein
MFEPLGQQICPLNIPPLRGFIAARQQHNDHFTTLDEVDAVTRPHIDP